MAPRNIIIDIKAKTSQYERSMKSASKSTDSLGQSLGNFAKKGALIGAAGIAVGITAIGAAAIKVGIEAATAFASFEKSLSQIEGLVGVAHDEVVQFGEDIKNLAVGVGRGPQELAEGLFFITSAGLEGAEAMDALEVSAKAAAAGLGETVTIADVVTSAMNAYGDQIDGASEATDVLVATVREGKAAAPELAGSLGSVIPIASAMGVSFDQVGAAIAAMTRTGLNAAEAGTALRSILNSLLAPTTDAKLALEGMGLSAMGLRRQIKDEGLFSTLETLNTAFEGQDEAITRVFGNVRALTGVMSLMGSNAEATEAIFDSLATSTGALDTAFGVAAETGAFAFEQAKVRIEVALLEVGQDILPKIADALDDIMPLVPDLVASIGDLTIALVDIGVTAVPAVISGLNEIELAFIKLETGILRAQQLGGTGLLGIATDIAAAGIKLSTAGLAPDIIGIDWDQDKADRLAWLEVQQKTIKRVQESWSDYFVLRDAINELTEAGLLNAESMRMVQDIMGKTDVEMIALIGDTDLLAQRFGLTEEQALILAGAFLEQGEAARDSAVAAAIASDEHRRMGRWANTATEAIEEEGEAIDGSLNPALGELRVGLMAAADAQESLADAVLAFASPTFKAVKAVKDLKKAEADLLDVQDDVKSTSEDIAAAQLAVVEAMFKAQGALDGVTGVALEGALAAITLALGITDEEARNLLETLGILDGTTVTSVVEVEGRLTGNQAAFDNTRPELMPGFADSKQHGGPVAKGVPYIVGEVGEELFIPNQSGHIVPNSQLGSLGSRSVTVNITGNEISENVDLAQATHLGLLMSGITEQVEFVGSTNVR